jgi:probable F420-dependent oxidoreductase
MTTTSPVDLSKPQLSIHLPNFTAADPGDWQHLFDRALAADAAGVDRLAVSDHVVFGEDLEAYGKAELGGNKGAKQPTGPDGHWLEPLTLLSVLAGKTERIRLGTSILLAALRRPVVLAKTAATLDVLSGGRLDLGVGVGWQKEEYLAAGLSFEGRGKLLDHSLEVCQTLWRNVPASYSSELLSFDRTYCVPQPLQAGGVPIWVSGTVNKKVIERLARFGSGWIPWGDDIGTLTTSADKVRAGLEALGRDPAGLQIQGHLPVVNGPDGIDLDATMAGLPPLLAAGITDFRAQLRIPAGRGEATEFLSEVVTAFRAAVGRTD